MDSEIKLSLRNLFVYTLKLEVYMKFSIIVAAIFLSYEVVATVKHQTETILGNGEDVIWSLEFHPKETHLLFFTERSGKIKSLNLITKAVTNYSGVPEVYSASQGGLLDLAFDPTTSDLYFTYSEKLGAGKNTTSLFKGNVDLIGKKITGKTIFRAKAESTGGYHFGSRIVLKKDALYMSVGERNDRDFSQNLNTHHGKILKLNLEGKAYTNNPFNGKNALPEIYSYGHRNPQGLVMDEKGNLYNSEFGPRGGDEINLVLAGRNYGWPVITYGKEYWGPKIGTTEKEGMEQPIKYWVPSISPSGIDFYNGKVFPEYQGSLFLANLSGQHLRRLELKDGKVIKEEELLTDLEERFRDVKVSPYDGFIYLATDSGKIIRVIPKKN